MTHYSLKTVEFDWWNADLKTIFKIKGRVKANESTFKVVFDPDYTKLLVVVPGRTDDGKTLKGSFDPRWLDSACKAADIMYGYGYWNVLRALAATDGGK